MQRNSFVKFCIAAGILILSPFSVKARRKRIEKGIFVQAGKDRHNTPFTRLPGDIIFNKVSTSDTDGDLYIFDTTRIKEGGPPLHFHYSQDEWWYVIAGEFLIKVGDETHHAKPGDCVFGPGEFPILSQKLERGKPRLSYCSSQRAKWKNSLKLSMKGNLKKCLTTKRTNFEMNTALNMLDLP